jgi:hypothetical protein
MVDRESVAGRGTITDLENGQYSGSFSVPMPGNYTVNITNLDLGSEHPSHVRGSPFHITCVDPWTKPRVLGTLPQKRKSTSLLPVGGDLVLYGGDKSRAFSLNTAGPDWRWATITLPDGAIEPPHRTAYGAALFGKNAMIVFAGINMADQSELADVWQLTNADGDWSWTASPQSLPFIRELKKQRAMELNKLPHPRPVPETGMHFQLTPADGHPYWLEGHRWNAADTHTVELTGVDPGIVKCVKFYLTDPKEEGAKPVHVVASAPYIMGVGEDGAAKAWKFAAGELAITAVAEPVTPLESGGEVTTVRESGTVMMEVGIAVRCHLFRRGRHPCCLNMLYVIMAYLLSRWHDALSDAWQMAYSASALGQNAADFMLLSSLSRFLFFCNCVVATAATSAGDQRRGPPRCTLHANSCHD